jgi:hypothetical protein
MFNHDIYIIKSEDDIKCLYINNLMFKIMFKVVEITKNYFDCNWFFIEEAIKYVDLLFIFENIIHKDKILIFLAFK